jgi:Ca2+-transporting ATPase
MQRLVFVTISGMIEGRGRAGAAALLILIWVASQCFSTLIYATNRAWGVSLDDWWRVPLRSLALLGAAAGVLPAEMAASALTRLTSSFLPGWASGAESLLLALSVQFLALVLFYRLAPRRPTRFADVWAAAMIAAILLRAVESAFVVYLVFFGASNAVYGVFGGIMALLLWIYISGCIFIYGACLCAARSELSAPRPFAAPPQ